jgi:hypothetical protein
MVTIKTEKGLTVTLDNSKLLSHWRGFSKYPTDDGKVVALCTGTRLILGPAETTEAVDTLIAKFYSHGAAPAVTYTEQS